MKRSWGFRFLLLLLCIPSLLIPTGCAGGPRPRPASPEPQPAPPGAGTAVPKDQTPASERPATTPGEAAAPSGPTQPGSGDRLAVPPPRQDPGCVDVVYRGAFSSAEPRSTRKFRLAARVCPDGSALLEFRGAVGGAALIAGLDGRGQARLLFPSRRIAVDGPDRPEFWLRWTGIALDGQLIPRPSGDPSPIPPALPGWEVEIQPAEGGGLPAEISARNREGQALTLTRNRFKPASGMAAWPAIPDGFRKLPPDGEVPPLDPPAEPQATPGS